MSWGKKFAKAMKKAWKDTKKAIQKHGAKIAAGVLAATGVGGPAAAVIMAGVSAATDKKSGGGGGGGSKAPAGQPTNEIPTEKKPLELKWWHYALLLIPFGFFLVAYFLKGKKGLKTSFRGRR